MSGLRYIWINIIQTCLRVFPFRCKTGLVKIGNPDRSSPVLLTCNFWLTVERLKKALIEIDAYLLVANSRGVNVWCAATGGLLTNHDVISVLKTSGIKDLVDHRKLILPQLAATGLEGSVINEKTGWIAMWGPVDMADIPAFLSSGFVKTREMRTVRFRWLARLEMAVAWAFPISVLTLLGYPWWKSALPVLVGLIWVLSALIFLGFPLYHGSLGVRGKRIGFVFFDFGQSGMALILWVAFLIALYTYTTMAGVFAWGVMARWGFASLVIVLILSMDLMGSTPMYKSGLHEDSLLRIQLNEERCTGVGRCEQVCPTDVFVVDYDEQTATLPRMENCVQCGACIVQCPLDALCFVSPEGNTVTPDTVRRFKLNLLGKRLVKTKSGDT